MSPRRLFCRSIKTRLDKLAIRAIINPLGQLGVPLTQLAGYLLSRELQALFYNIVTAIIAGTMLFAANPRAHDRSSKTLPGWFS